MTAKEKAIELYEKYFYRITKRGEYHWSHDLVKDCALIAVDGIMKINSVDKDYELFKKIDLSLNTKKTKPIQL
jgi:hypothetical protein